MGEKYTSLFVLPKGTNKVLTDEGWEFYSKIVFPVDFVSALVSALQLELDEEFGTIKKYKGVGSDLNAMFSEDGGVLHLHIKVYSADLDEVIARVQALNVSEEFDLFCPARERK